MATAFDSHFEKGASAQASPFSFTSNAGTVTGTVGGTNRVLIGYVGSTNSVASMGTVAMTWDGQTMTPIGTPFDEPGGLGQSLFMFGLIAPNTGNKVLQATYSTAPDICLGAVCISSADQSTGWSNFLNASGTGTTTSIVITTATDDMGVAFGVDSNATSFTITNGSLDWDERALNGNYMGGHRLATGVSTTIGGTLGSSVAWGMIGVRVLQFAGGATYQPYRSPYVQILSQ